LLSAGEETKDRTHARRILGLVDLLAESGSRLIGLALEVRLLNLLLPGGDEAAREKREREGAARGSGFDTRATA